MVYLSQLPRDDKMKWIACFYVVVLNKRVVRFLYKVLQARRGERYMYAPAHVQYTPWRLQSTTPYLGMAGDGSLGGGGGRRLLITATRQRRVCGLRHNACVGQTKRVQWCTAYRGCGRGITGCHTLVTHSHSSW